MPETQQQPSLRIYWMAWGLLLALTMGMLVTSFISIPTAVLVAMLLVGMMVKASVICAYFMHLRFEQRSLVIMVVLSIVLTLIVLFWLISYDAKRALELSGM